MYRNVTTFLRYFVNYCPQIMHDVLLWMYLKTLFVVIYKCMQFITYQGYFSRFITFNRDFMQTDVPIPITVTVWLLPIHVMPREYSYKKISRLFKYTTLASSQSPCLILPSYLRESSYICLTKLSNKGFIRVPLCMGVKGFIFFFFIILSV